MPTFEVTRTTVERQRVEAISQQDAIEQAEALPQRWQRMCEPHFSTLQIHDMSKYNNTLSYCALIHCIYHVDNPGPGSPVCIGCENSL